MSIEEKYPLLIGHSDQGSQELHSIQEVADFICGQGLESDLLITQEDGSYFLNTFGIYIDRIADMEYREALLKVLIPMQMELDGTMEVDEEPSPEDERLKEVNKRLEPFELYQCGNGKYGLSLPFSLRRNPMKTMDRLRLTGSRRNMAKKQRIPSACIPTGMAMNGRKSSRQHFRMMPDWGGFRLTARPEDFTATARTPLCWSAWEWHSRLSAMIRISFRTW